MLFVFKSYKFVEMTVQEASAGVYLATDGPTMSVAVMRCVVVKHAPSRQPQLRCVSQTL